MTDAITRLPSRTFLLRWHWRHEEPPPLREDTVLATSAPTAIRKLRAALSEEYDHVGEDAVIIEVLDVNLVH